MIVPRFRREQTRSGGAGGFPMFCEWSCSANAARAAALALWLAAAAAGPASGEEPDGLGRDLRESLYNQRTAAVVVANLPALQHDPLMQTFRGMFDPASLDIVRAKDKNFEKRLEKQIAGVAALAGGLTRAKYERATVVVLEYSGMKPFAALPLGFDMNDEAFMAAKFVLEGIVSAAKFELELTRRGDYVLAHPPGVGLAPAEHSAEVERMILLGLEQASGQWAVNFASPNSEYVRSMLAAWLPGELGGALGAAGYLGGHLVGGERPELHLYARFAGEEQAAGVKALYDRLWQDEIAKAAAEDAAEEKAKAEGKFVFTLDAYISRETMMRRLAEASGTSAFGKVVLLDLDTADLRQITGALVDRYWRPGPE
jgi:hypothetical protein